MENVFVFKALQEFPAIVKNNVLKIHTGMAMIVNVLMDT
jgi:hypothetical protein